MTEVQARVVELWSIVNGAAMLVLVVLSFSSAWLIMEGLAALDRWLRIREHGRDDDAAEIS